jgi:hypothetical protein
VVAEAEAAGEAGNTNMHKIVSPKKKSHNLGENFKSSLASQVIWWTGCAVLVVLGLWIRWWHLAAIPVGLYHDEMDYVLNGEAVAQFGTDLSGTWRPFELRPLHTQNYTAELPIAVHAVAQKIFGLGVESAHLPAALFGMMTVIWLVWFVWQATHNRMLSAATGIMVLTSPWHIYISRLGYEAVLSLFCQIVCVSMIWFLGQRHQLQQLQQFQEKKVNVKGKFRMMLAAGTWIFLLATAIVSFGLAYYLYHGAKFTMLVVVGVGGVWILRQKIPNWRKFAIVMSLCLTSCLLLGQSWQMKGAGAIGAPSQPPHDDSSSR